MSFTIFLTNGSERLAWSTVKYRTPAGGFLVAEVMAQR
jgi:hypothetical protein